MKNIKLKIVGIKDNISKEKLLKKLKEKKGIKNVEFIAINTDRQALQTNIR